MFKRFFSLFVSINLILVSCLVIFTPVSAESQFNISSALNPKPLATAITNATELQNMSSNLSGNYYLANDIECNMTKTWNSEFGFDPIGDLAKHFNGTFDGKGFKIINLTINRSAEDYVGLFGYISNNSNIFNVTLEIANVTGNSAVGGLIGQNNGTVINCKGTGNTTGASSYVGGLIGYNWGGPIVNCHSNFNTIATNDNIGGFLGYCSGGGLVVNCTSEGNTIGNNDVGGLIGENNGDIVENCKAYGEVNGNINIGGLIGRNLKPVFNSEAYGNTTALWDYAGGLIGYNDGGDITNCSSYGNTNGGNQYVGGLLGWNNRPVINCSSYGDTNGTWSNVGGLIAYNAGGIDNIINCYSYGNTTGLNTVGGLVGYCHGPVSNSTSFGTTKGQATVGGLIGRHTWYGEVFNCIANGNVTGTGDEVGGLIGRNDGIVTNCKAHGNTQGSADDVGGLIGINDGSLIKNCSATGDVNGTFNNVGGLISTNNGDIENCSGSGSVMGNNYVGGLVGINSGLITDSYATGKVDGQISIGGLLGFSSSISIINDSYATGSVNGTESIGGLGGSLNVKVNNSYATGLVTGSGTMIGGLIGYMGNGYINDSYATGYVSSSGGEVGGLVGYNDYGYINRCFARGDVKGGSKVGGLVGNNFEDINNSYAEGDVNGTSQVGGLVGFNNANINNSNASGSAYGTITSSDIGGLIGSNSGTIMKCFAIGLARGNVGVGGLIGSNSGPIYDCYALGNIYCTNEYSGGLIGSNNEVILDSFATGNVYGTLTAGGLIGNNNNNIMNCDAEGFVNGSNEIGGLIGSNDGTIEDCSALGNVNGTSKVGGLVGEHNTGTITLCSSVGTVIGIGVEIGGLVGYNDGNINKSQSYGFVWGNSQVGGFVGNNHGLIDNSSCTGDVNATGQSVGGFVGLNWDPIDYCYSTGSVFGKSEYTGGFVGYHWNVKISVCFCSGNVIGYNKTGGFAGGAGDARFFNCYSNGDVLGDDRAGGFIGDSSGNTNIRNCYSSGYVNGTSNVGGFAGENSGTHNCFWDNWTAGVSFGVGAGATSGVTGMNTTDMMKQMTFSSTSWDFTNVWEIVEGKSYPYFGFFFNKLYTKPEIITQTIPSATEDVFYSVPIEADYSIYPTNNWLTWKLTTNVNSWLTLDQNGILSGTPTNDDVGTFWAKIKVTDIFGNYVRRNFTLIILNTNDPPQIITTELENATEDKNYYFVINAADIDPTGDTFNWNLTTDANWLEIHPSTGALTGKPENADVGLYWLNVTLDDGNNGIDAENFTLNVTNVNDPPVILTENVTSVSEDTQYYVDYEASDIDPIANIFIWTLKTDAKWLSMNSTTGELIGTPMNKNIDVYWVNVTVDDGNGGFDWDNFSVRVNNVNDPPIITTENVTTTKEDDLYEVDYEADDIDPTNDILNWKIKTDAYWLDINSATGYLSGTPTNAEVREFWLNVTVYDGNGGSDWQNLSLDVININDPPTITTLDKKVARVGEKFSVDYNATDIDPTDDTLTWSLETDASNWLKIDSSSGELSGTPDISDQGTFKVNVTVSDGNDGLAWHDFILTVNPGDLINQNPKITTSDKKTATVGKQYLVKYEATDDRTPLVELVWTMDTNALWLSFNNSSRELSGTPADGDIGTYWVKIGVSDDEGGLASRNFTITVSKPPIENKKPKLTDGKMTPTSGDTATVFTFSVNYYDVEGDEADLVIVVIGNETHEMDLVSGDKSNGTWEVNVRLGEGIHDYYFNAVVGTDQAEPGDSSTPTSLVNAKTTPKIEKPKEKKEVEDNSMIYLAVLILIIIILFLAIIMTRRRKEEAEAEEKETEAEIEEEIADSGIEEEYEEHFTCPACGSIVTGGEVECPECGAEFEEEEFECPECGSPLGAEDTICPECGTDYTEEIEEEELEDEELTEEEPEKDIQE